MRDRLKGEITCFCKRLIMTNRRLSPLTSFLHRLAVSEWVSGVSRLTTARRYVIDDLANRIDTTCPWARVLTPVSYTSSIGCTVRIDYAFGSTTLVRISVKIGQAGAGSRARNFTAHSIRATW